MYFYVFKPCAFFPNALISWISLGPVFNDLFSDPRGAWRGKSGEDGSPVEVLEKHSRKKAEPRHHTKGLVTHTDTYLNVHSCSQLLLFFHIRGLLHYALIDNWSIIIFLPKVRILRASIADWCSRKCCANWCCCNCLPGPHVETCTHTLYIHRLFGWLWPGVKSQIQRILIISE